MLCGGLAMSKIHISIVVLCAAIATTPATAAAKKKPSSIASIQVACLKQVGAQYRPEEKRWYFYGPASTAQWQAFYNCLDAHTMQKR
jgi:hypothetical protein